MAQKARKPQAAKNGPKKAFPCDQCEKSYGQKAHLKEHVDTFHLGLKPYKCSQCDEAFGRRYGLTSHIKSVHENEFVCPTCKQSYASKAVMNNHIASVHEGIRHKCDLCDLTFLCKSGLWRHKKNIHNN